MRARSPRSPHRSARAPSRRTAPTAPGRATRADRRRARPGRRGWVAGGSPIPLLGEQAPDEAVAHADMRLPFPAQPTFLDEAEALEEVVGTDIVGGGIGEHPAIALLAKQQLEQPRHRLAGIAPAPVRPGERV